MVLQHTNTHSLTSQVPAIKSDFHDCQWRFLYIASADITVAEPQPTDVHRQWRVHTSLFTRTAVSCK
eukprot:m.94487 g.94487  ORF g.94487 m.94487 type:complete len:67 (-) comp13859_c1_seq2:195-395(-)